MRELWDRVDASGVLGVWLLAGSLLLAFLLCAFGAGKRADEDLER